VLDGGRALIVGDRWSGDYGGYTPGGGSLMILRQQPGAVALPRNDLTNPGAREPRGEGGRCHPGGRTSAG
jgi:hypothetical protein